MVVSFTCQNEFSNVLSEIDFLIQTAESYEKDADKYYTFNKSAILLLLAKFENFLENLIFEYVSNLEQLKLNPEQLSEAMKVQSTNSALNDQFFRSLRSLRPSAIEQLRLIMPLWSPSSSLDTIYANNKFDYGKHGSKSIKKLFRRIGINDVFSDCQVYEPRDTLAHRGKDRVKIDIMADINAMTYYRNNIIHEDRAPTLTHNQIQTYKSRLLLFASALVDLLDKNINQIKKTKK